MNRRLKKNKAVKNPVVCLCNGVRLQTIEKAIAVGATSLDAIFDQTLAGVGPCGGSCRKDLRRILERCLQQHTKRTQSQLEDTVIEIQVGHQGTEWLKLTQSKDGLIQLKAIGSLQLLKLVEQWRPHLKASNSPHHWPLPKGNSPAELLLRQLLLKAQDQWQLPYQEDELCHCRAVPTQVVIQAICAGAHTPEKISRWTSASTSCGTCRRDVESLLNYCLTHSSD